MHAFDSYGCQSSAVMVDHDAEELSLPFAEECTDLGGLSGLQTCQKCMANLEAAEQQSSPAKRVQRPTTSLEATVAETKFGVAYTAKIPSASIRRCVTQDGPRK